MGFEDELRNIALTLLRFGAFTSHALLFGLIPILVLVLRPSFAALDASEWKRGRARLARRLEGLLRSALIGSVVTTLLIVLLQSALISELDEGEVSSDSFLSVLETTFGQWLALRIPLAIALAVLLVGRVRQWSHRLPDDRATGDQRSREERGPGLVWWSSWGLLSLALLATTTFTGHAAVATPRLVAIVNDVVHLATGAAWFAGVVVLAVVLPDGWIGRDKVDRVQLLAPAVARFSRVAFVSITIVAITGTVNSLLHVGNLDDLWDTTYGQALALKIGLFLAILALGGINHYFIRNELERARAERTDTSARRTFRKTIAAELIVALALMVMTGLLTGLARTKSTPTPPPPDVATNDLN